MCNPYGYISTRIFDSLDRLTDRLLRRAEYFRHEPGLFIAPVYAYTGTSPTATGQIITGGTNVAVVSAVPSTSITSTLALVAVAGMVTIAVPTFSRSSTPNLPTSVPTLASNSISSSSSDPPEICGTTPKRRQPGLNYHRHHRHLSHR